MDFGGRPEHRIVKGFRLPAFLPAVVGIGGHSRKGAVHILELLLVFVPESFPVPDVHWLASPSHGEQRRGLAGRPLHRGPVGKFLLANAAGIVSAVVPLQEESQLLAVMDCLNPDCVHVALVPPERHQRNANFRRAFPGRVIRTSGQLGYLSRRQVYASDSGLLLRLRVGKALNILHDAPDLVRA